MIIETSTKRACKRSYNNDFNKTTNEKIVVNEILYNFI